jgi:hypothetical protein
MRRGKVPPLCHRGTDPFLGTRSGRGRDAGETRAVDGRQWGMDRARRSPARYLAVLVAGQVLTAAALVAAAARPPVAGAPWGRGLPRWVVTAPPVDAVVVVAHRVALVVALWLLAGTLLHVAAARTRVPVLVSVTARATLPGVRRAVAAVVVTAGIVAPGTAYATSGTGAGASAPPGVRDGRAAPVAVVVATPPTPATPLATPAAPVVTAVVVQPGDSLWTIAEQVTSPPDGDLGADVAARWAAICAANAGRLRSGDLAVVYPGEEIVIPEQSPG